jgi:hypothetical protein
VSAAVYDYVVVGAGSAGCAAGIGVAWTSYSIPVDSSRRVSVAGRWRYYSNMGSIKEAVIAALDAAEANYRKLAALPLEALTRPEKQALLTRLDELGNKITALDQRLIGQLITAGDPAMFGGASWADVLSRRLRISRGEAQRRIAEAACAADARDKRTPA